MSTHQQVSVQDVFSAYEKSGAIQLVDVREDDEFRAVHVAFSKHLPLTRLAVDPHAIDKLGLDPAQPVYLLCRSGGRSLKACDFFRQAGFKAPINVQGGILAWQQLQLPVA